MDKEQKKELKRHIATHSEKSAEDQAAVTTLEYFLNSEKIFCDFSKCDKWPNHDGTFEYVSNPLINRSPKKVFIVQIKGTSLLESENIHYQLQSLSFPAFIADDVSLDPGILFLVLNPKNKGKERVFFKFISPSFIESIDFKKNSKTIVFTKEDEIENNDLSKKRFYKKLDNIIRDYSIISKLDKNDISEEDSLKIMVKSCGKIDALIKNINNDGNTRDTISYELLEPLDNLCYSIMILNSYNNNHKSVSEALAWDEARLKKETRYLSDFFYGLKYIGRRIPEEGESERLMLKYFDYLWNIKSFIDEKYGHNKYLINLHLFPKTLPQIDEKYYKMISNEIVKVPQKPSPMCNSRYYIHSSNSFCVDGNRFYEITLQLAELYATKFHRIIVYSRFDIISSYSIKIAYHENEIELFGIKTTIKILDSYIVSINPRCLNLIGKMINHNNIINSKSGEYDALMNFLTKSGMNLIDFLDMRKESVDRILDEIYGKTNTKYFKETLEYIRKEVVEKKETGEYSIKYALLNMREDILEDIYSPENNSTFFKNLSIDYRCRPFETNPFISEIRGHKTTNNIKGLCRIVDDYEQYEKASPYIEMKKKINDTGELFFKKDSLSNYNMIETYNNSLNNWQKRNSYKIVNEDGLFYIESYVKKTLSILNKLQKMSEIPVDKQGTKNEKFIKNNKNTLDFSDKLKETIITNIFVKSHIMLIYGAAGTGKTRVIEYIFKLMVDSNILFLTNTHTALQNLRRRVGLKGATYETIGKYIKTRNNDYDLIIIDECSTIDNDTMLSFLQIIDKETLLVMTGDIYQIESIDYGNWFHYAKEIINDDSNVELLSNFRTNNEKLIKFWDSVRNKDVILTEKLIMDCHFSKEISEDIFEEKDKDEIVLCLNYDGKFGINNINKFFQDANKKGELVSWQEWKYKKGDRILFLDTNRFTKLYNNLKGLIYDIEKRNDKIIFTIDVPLRLTKTECINDGFEFISSIEEGTRIRFDVIASSDDNNEDRNKTVIPFQLGYAVTIHKAQGLEYNTVKLVIPSSCEEQITHSIFYTAITRAKENIIIYWSSETMKKVIADFSKDKVEHISLDIIENKLNEYEDF